MSESVNAAGPVGIAVRLHMLRDQLAGRGSPMSVLAFARHCGVPNSAMRDYMSGRVLPGVENLDSIARANGVTIDWLVRGGAKPERSLDLNLLEQITRLALRPLFRAGGLKPDLLDKLAKDVALSIRVFYQLSTAGGASGVMTEDQVAEAFEVLGARAERDASDVSE